MRVGVGAVVIHNDKILLVKRGYPPSKGYWSIPGGHMKEDENVFQTAIRELREETGLEGEPVCIIGLDELEIRSRSQNSGVLRKYILVDVLVKIEFESCNVSPQAGSDAVDAAFMELEKAVSMPNIALSTKSFIYRLLKQGKHVTSGRGCYAPVPAFTILYERSL